MNPRKDSFEAYSQSTQDKYVGIGCSRFWDEEIEIVLRDGTGQTLRVFVGMMPSIRMADGYLVRGDAPITSLEISRKLNITQKEAGQALRELKKLRVFSQTAENVYYSPRMVALFRKGTKSDEKREEANFRTENFHEGDFEKQNSQVKSSLVELSGSSGELTTELTTQRLTRNDSPEHAVGCATAFRLVTEQDFAEVAAKYPHLDAAEVNRKFVEKNQGTEHDKVNRAWLEGFYAMENKHRTPKTAAKPMSPTAPVASAASAVPSVREFKFTL
jgi:hypothetical protein